MTIYNPVKEDIMLLIHAARLNFSAAPRPLVRQKGMHGMTPMQGHKSGANELQLLFGAVMVGIVLVMLLELVVQLLPPHYSPLSQSESDLAVGPYGFLMAFGFAIGGVLLLLFIAGFRRAVPKPAQSSGGLILLRSAAIGKLIIAFAATDLTSRPHTLHGAIHALAAVLSFFCGALGLLLLSIGLRRDAQVRPSARVLVGLARVTLIWTVLVIGTLVVSAQIGVWGLLERIATGLYLFWVFIVSLGFWRAASQTSRDRSQQRAFPSSPGEIGRLS
jgi:hypothetical protein